MRTLLFATVLAGAATVAATPALAAQGCGPGAHRGNHGRCIVNRGGPVIARVGGPAVALRVGGFYPGRGYWDGRRYYKARYRHQGGWRYR